jgi:hypothetical protein
MGVFQEVRTLLLKPDLSLFVPDGDTFPAVSAAERHWFEPSTAHPRKALQTQRIRYLGGERTSARCAPGAHTCSETSSGQATARLIAAARSLRSNRGLGRMLFGLDGQQLPNPPSAARQLDSALGSEETRPLRLCLAATPGWSEPSVSDRQQTRPRKSQGRHLSI